MHLLTTLVVAADDATRFQWGPWVLAALGIVGAVLGFFIRRLVIALDKAIDQLSSLNTEVTVVKTVITSGIEARLTALENKKE